MKIFEAELFTCILVHTFIAIYGTFDTFESYGASSPYFVKTIHHWRLCPNGDYGKTRCRPEFKFDCMPGYKCIKSHVLSKTNSVYCGVCCKTRNFCPPGQIQGPVCSFKKPCPFGYSCNRGVCCLATMKASCPMGSRPMSKCDKYSDCLYGSMCIHGTCCSVHKKASFCPMMHFPLPGIRCKHDLHCPGSSRCYGNTCCKSKFVLKRPPKKAPPIFKKKLPPISKPPIVIKHPKLPPKLVQKLPIKAKDPIHPLLPVKPIRRPVVPPNIKSCPVGYKKLPGMTCTHLSACPGTSECISGVCCSKSVQDSCPVDHRIIPEINCRLRQRCPQGSKCISGVCCLPLRMPPSCPGGLVLVPEKSCEQGTCAGNGICISGSCCRVATPPPTVTNPPMLFELPRIPPVRVPSRRVISTRAPIHLTMPPNPQADRVITLPTPLEPQVRAVPRFPDLQNINRNTDPLPTLPPSFGTTGLPFLPSSGPLGPNNVFDGPSNTPFPIPPKTVLNNLPSIGLPSVPPANPVPNQNLVPNLPRLPMFGPSNNPQFPPVNPSIPAANPPFVTQQSNIPNLLDLMSFPSVFPQNPSIPNISPPNSPTLFPPFNNLDFGVTPNPSSKLTPSLLPNLPFTFPNFPSVPPLIPDNTVPAGPRTTLPPIPFRTAPPMLPFDPTVNLTSFPTLSPLASVFPGFPPLFPPNNQPPSGTFPPGVNNANNPPTLPTGPVSLPQSGRPPPGTPTGLGTTKAPKPSLQPGIVPTANPVVDPIIPSNTNPLNSIPRLPDIFNPNIGVPSTFPSAPFTPTKPPTLPPLPDIFNPDFGLPSNIPSGPLIPTTLPTINVPKLLDTLPSLPPVIPLDNLLPPLPSISLIDQILNPVSNATPPPPVVKKTTVPIGPPPIVDPKNRIPRPPPIIPPPPTPSKIPRPPQDVLPPLNNDMFPPLITLPPLNNDMFPPLITLPPNNAIIDPVLSELPTLITPPPDIFPALVQIPDLSPQYVNISKVQIPSIVPSLKLNETLMMPTPILPLFNFTVPPFDPLIADIIPPYSAPPIIPPGTFPPVIPPAQPSPAGPTFPPFFATVNTSTFMTTPPMITNSTPPSNTAIPPLLPVINNQPLLPTVNISDTPLFPFDITFPPFFPMTTPLLPLFSNPGVTVPPNINNHVPTLAPFIPAVNAPLPFDNFTNPLDIFHIPTVNNFTYPIDNFPYPHDNFTYPHDNFTFPTDNFTYPINNFTYPINNFTYPINNQPHPANNHPHPVHNITHPVHNLTHPVHNHTLPSHNATSHNLNNTGPRLNVSQPVMNVTDLNPNATYPYFNDTYYDNTTWFYYDSSTYNSSYPYDNTTYIDDWTTTDQYTSNPNQNSTSPPNLRKRVTKSNVKIQTTLPSLKTTPIKTVTMNTTLPPTLWVTLKPVNKTKPTVAPKIPTSSTPKYIFNFTFPNAVVDSTLSPYPTQTQPLRPDPSFATKPSVTPSAPPTTFSPPSLPTSCPAGNITIPGLSCDKVFKCPAGSTCYYGFCCLPYQMVQVPACLVNFVVTDVCPQPPEPDQCRYDRDCGPFMTCCLNSCDRRVCRPTVDPKPSKPR